MKKLGSLTHFDITKRLDQLDELRNSILDILNISAHDIKLWPVISKQQLIVFTENPILATQIKYQQKKVCTHINNVYTLNLRGVHTKLIPSTIASEPVNIRPTPLKKSTSKILSSIADQIEDNELKQILKEISLQNNKQ